MATPADKPVVPGGFTADSPSPSPYNQDVPESLRRATSRLQFPPSYVVVGFYRLVTDSKLRVPAWQKCKHGFVRGASVGLIWVSIGRGSMMIFGGTTMHRAECLLPEGCWDV